MRKWKVQIEVTLSPGRVAALLNELCIEFGYCEANLSLNQLAQNPPRTIDEFLDEVVRLEGIDPRACDRRNELRAVVETQFVAEAEAASLRNAEPD